MNLQLSQTEKAVLEMISDVLAMTFVYVSVLLSLCWVVSQGKILPIVLWFVGFMAFLYYLHNWFLKKENVLKLAKQINSNIEAMESLVDPAVPKSKEKIRHDLLSSLILIDSVKKDIRTIEGVLR
ncbi:MAG: hypothetical protein ACTSV7_14005 [Candidatus Baldrarchaeia archaeon]